MSSQIIMTLWGVPTFLMGHFKFSTPVIIINIYYVRRRNNFP